MLPQLHPLRFLVVALAGWNNQQQREVIDFLQTENRVRLTRYVVLFVMELATRRVHIAGIASEPDSAWVVQCSRQLTDAVDGFLVGKRFLLHDGEPLFTEAFRETLAVTGVETVRLPPKSPNLNAFAERFVRSIKESCLNRMILVSEHSLRRAVREFVAHYHHERNHQGLGNVLILPRSVQMRGDDPIVCRERLGGLLSTTIDQPDERHPDLGGSRAGTHDLRDTRVWRRRGGARRPADGLPNDL